MLNRHSIDEARLYEAVAANAHRLADQLLPFADQQHHHNRLITGVHRVMDRALTELAELNCWGTANQVPSSQLWKIAGPLLGRGTLQYHAQKKPRGYAGDFEMLDWICEDRRFGAGLSWALDDYFQKQAAPTAVRNRAHIVATHIATASDRMSYVPTLIVSLGCGPAYDLRLLGKRLTAREDSVSIDNTSLTLIDIDPRALDFATSQLRQYFPHRSIATERLNLKRIVSHPTWKRILQKADFLSCPGFFDYLNHEEATNMLSHIWHGMKPSSELLIFAFSKDNPSRAYMEWIGNWYLIYRSFDEMHDLARAAGIPDNQYVMDVEPAGVNLFLHARK